MREGVCSVIDYSTVLNQKVQAIKPSGIRRFFDIANEMDNVISLSIGEPDFTTPWHVREEGIRSLEDGKTWYSPNRGFIELRQEISRWLKRHYHVNYNDKEEILVTVGGSEAIDLCLRSLISPGDEVLIPEPSFVCYVPLTEMAGGVPVVLETKAEDRFRITPEALRAKITPKTKLLILPYPNNPTGAVMRREHLEAIAEVVRENDLMVLSDEIYSALTYGDTNHVTFSAIDGMWERTIVVNGFSKAFAMTGWRLGYAVGPAQIIKAMTKLHQYGIMSAPTTAQYAAIEALKNGDEDIVYMREQYDMRRRLVVDGFNSMGLTCFEPEGAFYVFPCIKKTGLTSEEFCERLLYEERVAVVPGSAFGDCGEGFVRVSYSYSIKHITEALSRIEHFIKQFES
ncbi:MAG: aminotransferase class I/II-fold pyridoxal phosphate-dependent enzyme [Clostridium sp.]|uniref:Aminotransferase n=1 Tax=Anaeromassilibacillus senegalensis TaxID=1673717 RepID=A0ABS9MHR7_9FIRM|nr:MULTISPECIES: aminotransferase class I/II-fold pyridoxal phosphate-dependent enzyme [Anaeromassilibacillus]MBS5622125.1 aminotransferase class I/II-fold pyridoxal phosphate-dependent enzyme [Clostridium sp.]MCG4610359.1 aminotransferase class I/II-fold pyridoxal phosphate-dependent enzyme [Anaeromassilibacillus senegalensis]OUO74271.1 aromatic amino acid aminotransferase [Anaeromassilibacillus sp. An250]HJB50245.1 aminotransferase class I/II-fold pyridoxal phosphate-dependent enzyme [Candida